VLVFAISMMGGLLVSLLVRRRRVWVRLTPVTEGAGQAPGTVNVELGGLARTDNSGWGDEFEKLAERLVADLGESSASRRSSQVDVT
jgi:cytochrome c biogenesis protein